MPFRFGKSKIAGLLEYLIALILVFDINTIWLRKDNLGDDFFTYVGVIFMIVYILYSGKLKKRNYPSDYKCYICCTHVNWKFISIYYNTKYSYSWYWLRCYVTGC